MLKNKNLSCPTYEMFDIQLNIKIPDTSRLSTHCQIVLSTTLLYSKIQCRKAFL